MQSVHRARATEALMLLNTDYERLMLGSVQCLHHMHRDERCISIREKKAQRWSSDHSDSARIHIVLSLRFSCMIIVWIKIDGF